MTPPAIWKKLEATAYAARMVALRTVPGATLVDVPNRDVFAPIIFQVDSGTHPQRAPILRRLQEQGNCADAEFAQWRTFVYMEDAENKDWMRFLNYYFKNEFRLPVGAGLEECRGMST